MIHYIKEKLESRIDNLNLKVLEDERIEILPTNEDGFTIKFFYHPHESLLLFGDAYHEHIRFEFDTLDDVIDQITLGLVGGFRIKETYYKNKLFRCVLQDLDSEDSTSNGSAILFPSWKFWRKQEYLSEKLLQNNYQLRIRD